MLIFRFERLIKKYSVDCQKVTIAPGKWKSGEWIPGEEVTEPYECAVVPITEKRINNSGGEYKAGDADIITLHLLPTDGNTYIVHKDKKYKVQQITDYSDYADFNHYLGRRVSAFDTDKTNTKDTDRRA